MVPKESTYLLAGPDQGPKAPIRINMPNKQYVRQELTREDLRYYTASPLWIKIRLILFWLFWTAFLIMLILSISMYCCAFPSVTAMC